MFTTCCCALMWPKNQFSSRLGITKHLCDRWWHNLQINAQKKKKIELNVNMHTKNVKCRYYKTNVYICKNKTTSWNYVLCVEYLTFILVAWFICKIVWHSFKLGCICLWTKKHICNHHHVFTDHHLQIIICLCIINTTTLALKRWERLDKTIYDRWMRSSP